MKAYRDETKFRIYQVRLDFFGSFKEIESRVALDNPDAFIDRIGDFKSKKDAMKVFEHSCGETEFSTFYREPEHKNITKFFLTEEKVRIFNFGNDQGEQVLSQEILKESVLTPSEAKTWENL
jgi:hypothetical protein